MEQTYDVVIIGGGAAGLSGALALGRSRRSVLVIDAGAPRNAPAGHVHNYLGREGTAPSELLAIGRHEVAGFGVQIRSGAVKTVTRQDDDSFLVPVDDLTFRARRLLVTTGLTDVLPDVPGVAEGWGSTVVHCSYCHGWEIRDQAIGVLGLGPMSLHQAQLFRQWSSDVIFFQHTAPELSAAQDEEFAARGIGVVTGAVASWEGDAVRLESGEVIARQALVVGAAVRANSDLLAGLGLSTTELVMNGVVLGTYVAADPTGLTKVPGVWVAGNIADPRAVVISSAAAGLAAGAAINADLIVEDTRIDVARHRRTHRATQDA